MSSSRSDGQVETILATIRRQETSETAIIAARIFARAHPEAILDLARAIVTETVVHGGEVLPSILAWLPEADWEALVRIALDALRTRGDNWAAITVINSACDQASAALRPHLERFFRLQARKGQHIDIWPWRDSGTTSLDFLRGIVVGPESDKIRYSAWEAMLETRDPIVIAEAIRLRRTTGFFGETSTPFDHFSHEFYRLDFDATGPELRRLFPDSAYHLIFPRSAFAGLRRPPEIRWDDRDWPPPPRRLHPTWMLEPAPEFPPMRFGGFGRSGRCPRCTRRLNRYLLLDPVPTGLGVSDLPRLELATCLTCIGPSCSLCFSRHDADGWAESIEEPYPILGRQDELGPLLELEVRLASTPQRWRRQNWFLENGEENLNRIGGELTSRSVVTAANYNFCKVCGKVMTFLLQFDSYIPAADGTEWWWANRGIGVVLWCDQCKISGYRVESEP